MGLFKKIKYATMMVIVCITICITELVNSILEKEVQ